MVEDPSRLSPIASIADDIVLAVYIPPHEPGPGQAFFSTWSNRAASILPAEY